MLETSFQKEIEKRLGEAGEPGAGFVAGLANGLKKHMEGTKEEPGFMRTVFYDARHRVLERVAKVRDEMHRWRKVKARSRSRVSRPLRLNPV